MSDSEICVSGVCIYTPETFVEVLISGLGNSVEGIYCTSDVQVLLKKCSSKDFENILIYSETLSRPTLASLVIKISSINPKLNVFFLDGTGTPELHRIHPAPLGEEHASMKMADLNFERVIDLIRNGFDLPGQEEAEPKLKLTKHQWAVLRFVGEGLSNAEIAKRRNCTPRAVETILNRTMFRLGIDPSLSSRGRTVAVLKFLESAK